MKVVVMYPNGQICTQNISRPVHRSAGAIVGGLIETVNPVRLQRPYCMLVNESFLIDGLPINPVGSYLYGADLHGHPICGNVIISRVAGEDLETLTDHEAQQLVRTMEAVKRLLTEEDDNGDQE